MSFTALSAQKLSYAIKKFLARNQSGEQIMRSMDGSDLEGGSFSLDGTRSHRYYREEAWTEKRDNRTAVHRDSEGSCSYREKGGKVTLERSQQWNTKTGRQIRTEEKQTQPSSSYNFMDMFLNDLTPPSADNFQTCLSNELPCDPFFVEIKVDADDIPSSSGGGGDCISHVTLNLRKGEAWAEEVKLTDKKSKLTKFLSRFKRAKTTKVKKIPFLFGLEVFSVLYYRLTRPPNVKFR